MIEKIEVSGCASYGHKVEVMDSLSLFNYVYGPNGAGKTTLSRLIANPLSYAPCKVQWKAGTILETMVYSRDFVDRNFNQSTGLKGIFTLGEKDIAILQQIADKKIKVDGLHQKIESLRLSLGSVESKIGKHWILTKIEQDFTKECWKLKKIHDAKLQGALTGYRNDAQRFSDKLSLECAKATVQVFTQNELESKAESIFGPSPLPAVQIVNISGTAFLSWEGDPILKKRVLGGNDVDIAAIIQKLGNSDWVKQGVGYLEAGDGECPFCQQPVPMHLTASLQAYFDEAFLKDSGAITAMQAGYKLGGERLLQFMQQTINSNPPFLEIDRLITEMALFDSRFQMNLLSIESKRKEPSQIVNLETLQGVVVEVRSIIDKANQKISDNNKIVANLSVERQTLTAQVWTFLANIIKTTTFSSYEQARTNAKKAIVGTEAQIASAESEMKQTQSEIAALEKTTTSIQPTVNDINKILGGFGFKNFSLASTASGNFYQICRSDGSDVKDTLSEGEKSFISFLYFYHLLKGSESSSGMTNDRVVVFDDPVSSLDSDILFIVGSLIKHVHEEVRSKVSHIKQVFVFTHNVYFHKEVTFNPKRKSGKLLEETFWTIHKVNGMSTVQRHETNPIKTSYDLLWSEVRKPNLSSQTLQNTLRRVLENYFRILGDMDTDQICSKFDGHERITCKSLFSWVNDGSHSIHDDIHIAVDEKAAETFVAVFHKIFNKLGHESHYKMMMGDSYVELPVNAPVAA